MLQIVILQGCPVHYLKSMKQEKRNWLSEASAKVFVRSNQLPPYLQVLCQCMEFLLYIPVIYGLPLTRQLLPPNLSIEPTLAIIFALLLLLRVFRGINMIKGIYVLVLQCLLIEDVEITAPKIILAILYTILVIVDIAASISFDFYSEEISSESLNICKICHWVLMGLSVGHSLLVPRSIIAQALSSAGFLLLFLLRHASMMKNNNYKHLLLRFYLWLAICHIHIITTHFINLPNLAQIFVPLIISQLIFAVYQSRLAPIKLDQLHSQQKYLKLAYEVCKYMHGNTYNTVMERELQIFVGEVQPGIRDVQRKIIIYQKLSQLLTRDKSFKAQLLSAQIALFCNHQLLHSKKILQGIKRKLPSYYLLQRLLVFRLEEALLKFYKDKNQEIHFAHYECYYRCDDFRSLLLKSTLAFINLWEYSRRPEVSPQKLRALADRTVKFEDQISKQFELIEVKCVTLSLLFVSYLFQVARDITKGNKILQALAFNEDFQINFQLDEKVFVRLGLEEEPLRIQKVGQNVSSLLGYDRKELQGHGHQVFLPQFYRKSHKEYVIKFFEQQFQGLYLYNKKTLIRHKWGYYQECNVVLRLHLNLGGALRLEGYFQVKNNPKYAWNSYLFLNENQDVVQAAETLPELVPSAHRLKKATDYFESPVSITAPLTHRLQNSKMDYHPLMLFEAEGQKIAYFARYVQSDSGASLEAAHQKVMNMLNSMNIVKFDWEFIKGYFVKLQASIDRIKNREYIVLAILSLIFLCGLLVCESYFYNGMNAKNDRQTNVMDGCTDIINYYNSSLKLGMDVNYVDLQTLANYQNDFSNVDMINEALHLQTYNEHLKSLSLKSYTLPSLITGISYNKPNYDMVVEFLANAYMIKQFDDDPFVRNSSLARARISIQSIYSNSLGQYKSNFSNNINSLPPDDQVINYIVISILLLLASFLLAIVFRVEWRIRADEQQTLSLITNLRDQQSMIDTSKQFSMKITRQELIHSRDDYQHRQKDSFVPDMTATARQVSRSEMSLRQISGRNLMEDSFNKSGILHTQITGRGERNGIIGNVIASMGSGQLRISARKKSILFAGLLAFAAIGSLGVSHQIRNNSLSSINEVDSANNVLLLYRTSSFYSRAVVSLINLIAIKSSGGSVNSSVFEAYLKTYNQFQVIVTFPESSLPQFSLFQTLLTQLQYQYMCSFITCDPNFSNEVNIIYTTTVQKIVQNMGSILSVINNSTSTDIIQQLKTGLLKYQVDLMFYSENLIRELLTRAVLVYMDSFNDYKDNLNAYKKLFIGTILISTGVGGLLLIILSAWIVRHQWYLLKIGNLIKTESYINDDSKGQQKENSKMAATTQ